jgi:t-SNARE complex subunit (syntaxin)
MKESKIILKEVVGNKEALEIRQKELEHIKKISGQLKGMTEHMALTVKEQGEVFGKLEDHVVEIKDNALGAEHEIGLAEKDTRRTTRKLVFLFCGVLFVVVSLVAVLLMILLPKSS